MDTLSGLPECVEGEFSESIVSRDDALAVLAAAPGLGPPDLCWLQKGRGTWAPGVDGIAQGSRGYYHYVLGGDVGSSGAIAGQFAGLMARVERPGLLAGLWHGSELSVQRGFYCCYDAISQMDLRCELCVPGGVVCGLVDADGNLHEANDQQLWRQAQVCAFVRAQLYDPEMVLNGGCIIVNDPLPSAAAEQQLLSAVEALYQQGVLPAGLDAISLSQGYGAAAEHSDLVLFAVWHHFRKRQRWDAAHAFFARLSVSYPAAAVWEAAALRASSHSEGTMELLSSSLQHDPNSAPLLTAMAAECMRLQQVDTAGRMARKAVAVQSRFRPAWLMLARCYAAEGQYAEALVTLNAVPTPPLPRDERELLMVVPPPEPEKITVPQVRSYQADLEAARALALEEGDTSGVSRLLAYLPGAVLLNKEPADAGPWPDASPNRVTRAVLGAVYLQLQEMVGALGWDGFLAVRSSVFVMHEHTRSSSMASAAGARMSTAGGAATAHVGLKGDQQHPNTRTHAPAAAPPGGTAHSAPSSDGARANGHQRRPDQGHQQQEEQEDRAEKGTQQQATPQPLGSRAEASITGGSAAANNGSRRSSATGSKAEGADPAAFYASRLQAALGASQGPYVQQQVPEPTAQQQQQQLAEAQAQVPGQAAVQMHEQQHQKQQLQQLQQQQQQQPAQQARSSSGLPQPGQGAVFEPMAGRVLLLGRRTRKLKSMKEGQGGRSSGSGGYQPSSSLSSRAGVEGLSRLTSATIVAALPNQQETHPALAAPSSAAQASSSSPNASNPQLWETVFGSNSQRGVSTPQDALVTPPGGLPRIRTRPVGEACESAKWRTTINSSSGGAGGGGGRGSLGSSRGMWGCGFEPHSWLRSQHRVHTASRRSWLSRARLNMFACYHTRAPCSEGQAVAEGNENVQQQQQQQQQHQQQPQQQLGLLKAGSLLLRNRASSGTPGSIMGSTRSGLLHGPLYSVGSRALYSTESTGALLPGVTSRHGSAAGIGPQLRSLEADREAIAAGKQLVRPSPSNSTLQGGGGGQGDSQAASPQLLRWEDSSNEAPGSQDTAMRLCVRWLDELVVALWHDLSAYLEWRCLDQSLRESRGVTHAELVLGSHSGRGGSSSTTPSAVPPGSDQAARISGSGDAAGPTPPVLTASDWARRGFLAERLGHTHNARTAYRVAVTLAFSVTAYTALLRLEAQAGAVADALMSAQQLLLWHDARAAAALKPAAGGSSSSPGLLQRAPMPVQWFMAELLAGRGADRVQRALTDDSTAHSLLLREVDLWQQQHERDRRSLSSAA